LKNILILALLLTGCASQKTTIIQTINEPIYDIKPVKIKYVAFGLWKVKKHDTLWAISKKTYGDPFKWPDIYKLNKDKIKNPDLIYPKQLFLFKLKGREYND